MSQTSKKARELLDAYQKQNLQMEMQLRGAGALPEGYQSTYLETTGPQGFGEGLLNTLGLYKDTKTQPLLTQAQANYAILSQAVKNLTEKETEETEDRNREKDAYDIQQLMDSQRELYDFLGDRADQRQERAAQLALQTSVAQTRALLPYIDEAARRTTERNLDASKRYKAFKEQLPSSIQAIMESKQRQQDLASSAFAKEAGAIATQQQAATGFAGLGTGRRFG